MLEPINLYCNRNPFLLCNSNIIYKPGKEFLCVDRGETRAGRGDNAGLVICCWAKLATSSTAEVTLLTTELTFSGDSAAVDTSVSASSALARKLTTVTSSHSLINMAKDEHRRFTALVSCGDRLQYGLIAENKFYLRN